MPLLKSSRKVQAVYFPVEGETTGVWRCGVTGATIRVRTKTIPKSRAWIFTSHPGESRVLWFLYRYRAVTTPAAATIRTRQGCCQHPVPFREAGGGPLSAISRPASDAQARGKSEV